MDNTGGTTRIRGQPQNLVYAVPHSTGANNKASFTDAVV